MDKKTIENLLELGWNEDWLHHVLHNFKPKTEGKYKMQVFDIEELGQSPESGLLIETTYFDTEEELSLIHYFFEGFGYVMTVSSTEELIGTGIIDGAPFDEVEPYEGTRWNWIKNSEIESLYNIDVMLPGAKTGDVFFVSVANQFSGRVRLIAQEKNRMFVSVISSRYHKSFPKEDRSRSSIWIRNVDIIKMDHDSYRNRRNG